MASDWINVEGLTPVQLSALIRKIPNCPHWRNRTCEWSSAKLGRVVGVDTHFCNFKCGAIGPLSGPNFTSENEIKFMREIWLRANPTGGYEFAQKVLNHHYKMPVDVVIPEDYPKIKEALSVLKDVKGFLGFYLTGSVIIKTACNPPKDYDIALRFDSVKSILSASNLNDILPKEINGVKTDYYYYIGESPEVYFACLDVENKTLYTSPWFDLKIRSIDKDIKIVSVDSRFKEVLKVFFPLGT